MFVPQPGAPTTVPCIWPTANETGPELPPGATLDDEGLTLAVADGDADGEPDGEGDADGDGEGDGLGLRCCPGE
ncbi:MAG: hypothetical protein NVS3B26_04620 [Mycobacteriales bacterium]